MPVIEWTQYAQKDLLEILDYVSEENPAAAWRLRDEISCRVADLPSNPRLYRAGREVGTREMVVQPNYIVVYAETTASITILRVLHAARQWPSDAKG